MAESENELTLHEHRMSFGLTQAKAALLCRVTLRTWQKWESRDAQMSLAAQELFFAKALALKLIAIQNPRGGLDPAVVKSVVKAIGLDLNPGPLEVRERGPRNVAQSPRGNGLAVPVAASKAAQAPTKAPARAVERPVGVVHVQVGKEFQEL